MLARFTRRRFATSIEAILRGRLLTLNPSHLQIVNESASHSRGAESHFNIVVVAERFTGLSRLEKHQLVHELLEAELRKIHALTLTCKSPEEWKRNTTSTESPGCVGKQPL